MGKTAFGLGVARNAARGGVGLFFSMGMSRTQVSDRKVSALAKIPHGWLMRPSGNPSTELVEGRHSTAISHAIAKTREISLIVDY